MKKKPTKEGVVHPGSPVKGVKASTSMDAPPVQGYSSAERDSLYQDMSIPIEKRRLQEAEAAAKK